MKGNAILNSKFQMEFVVVESEEIVFFRVIFCEPISGRDNPVIPKIIYE